jgi:hypothetical protein
MTPRRRWDGDAAGTGMRDAAEWQTAVDDFRSAMGIAGWVTEDPETHLLPSMRVAAAEGSAELVSSTVVDGVLEVDIAVAGEGRRGVRQIALSILGSVAEEASFIREVEPGVFECLTGTIASEQFDPHGHVIRLSVTTT